LRLILLVITGCLLLAPTSFAYWEWSPKTGKWTNPKYAPKESAAKQWEYSLSCYEKKDYEKALAEFKKMVKFFPREEKASEAQYMVGVCFEKLGKFYEAAKAYQKTVEKYPSTDRLEDIVKRQREIADAFYNRESVNIWVMTKEFFTEDRWAKAAHIYYMALKNYPYYEDADEIQYRVGLCYLEAKQYPQAIAEFKRLLQEYPHSELTDDADYQIALCWARQSLASPYDEKLCDKAIKKLEEFTERYPDTDLAKEAKKQLANLRNKGGEKIFQIATFYEKKKEKESAKIYYEEVIDRFPNSIWAKIARMKLEYYAITTPK